MKIGGVSVECITGDLIMMWDMLSAKAGKEASARHGGDQDKKHRRGDNRHECVQECIVDLPMWFCASKNGGEYCYALNLNGMSLHKVELVLKLNSAHSIIIPDGNMSDVKVREGEEAGEVGKPKGAALKEGDKAIADGDIQVDLIHEFVYLGDEERQMMSDASSETVIVAHQTMSSKRSTAKDLCTQLYFNGAVSELMRWAMENAFKQLDPHRTRIVLVDPGERVLRAMPIQQSEAALESLQRDGIEFIHGSRV